MGTAMAEREGSVSALEGVLEDAVAGRGRALFMGRSAENVSEV